MKPLILAFGVVFAFGGLSAQTPAWQPSPGHMQVPIWPGAVPDAQPAAAPEVTTTDESLIADKRVLAVNNVSRPAMTVYSPMGKNTGAAVVVFPGGGYQILAIDLEGTEVCDWLTSIGASDVSATSFRNHRRRSKMRRGPWGWCAFTPRSGISIRTRLECWGFRQAGIWWRRSARILSSVCTPL
jgi:hypothetical protein